MVLSWAVTSERVFGRLYCRISIALAQPGSVGDFTISQPMVVTDLYLALWLELLMS